MYKNKKGEKIMFNLIKNLSFIRKSQKTGQQVEQKVYLPCDVLFGNLKRQKAEKEVSTSVKSF